MPRSRHLTTTLLAAALALLLALPGAPPAFAADDEISLDQDGLVEVNGKPRFRLKADAAEKNFEIVTPKGLRIGRATVLDTVEIRVEDVNGREVARFPGETAIEAAPLIAPLVDKLVVQAVHAMRAAAERATPAPVATPAPGRAGGTYVLGPAQGDTQDILRGGQKVGHVSKWTDRWDTANWSVFVGAANLGRIEEAVGEVHVYDGNRKFLGKAPDLAAAVDKFFAQIANWQKAPRLFAKFRAYHAGAIDLEETTSGWRFYDGTAGEGRPLLGSLSRLSSGSTRWEVRDHDGQRLGTIMPDTLGQGRWSILDNNGDRIGSATEREVRCPNGKTRQRSARKGFPEIAMHAFFGPDAK